MGHMFSSPKSVKPPPVPPPEPVPQVIEETEEELARKRRKRSDFSDTLLTGELEPVSKRKTLLG